MLERASDGEVGVDCEDPLVMTACLLDSEDCPAACREADEDPEDIVVKSGDLAVTASASSTKKIILGGVSDTDTLKFKTSEEVEISKITLERFGYSSNDDIENVRLEDADGTVIAEPKSVNSKDQVVLTLKKDYRTVDGTLNATIVVETSDEAKVGRTIGFKVISAESTAKNLNLDDYDPYTYEMVEYDGSVVTITPKDNGKDYNYEEGKSYEVAKFKVKAGSNAISVKGFTLSNTTTTQTGVAGKSILDVQDFLDDVEVLANGEAVKADFSVNSDDELVIALDDEYELASKANVTFTVEAAFEGLDEYGKYVHYEIAEASDFNAVEKKTGSRIQVEGLDSIAWGSYVFLGGKVKITNTKLGNIDASQGAEDVLVAEGNITTPEALDKVTVELHARNIDGTTGAKAIDGMRLVINGDEYDGDIDVANNGNATITFKNVEVEKSGKVKFYVDIIDDEKYLGSKFTFDSFGPKTITAARYEESRESALGQIAGSISFGDITVQAAKGSLENNIDDAVSFLGNESNRKVIFDGTVSARKADFYLKEFTVDGTDTHNGKDDFTFYLFLDGEEVANADLNDQTSFSNVLVKAGESVKVKVEAEVDAEEATTSRYYNDFSLLLDGEDDNGVAIATLQEPCVELKVVAKGQVKVSAETAAKTVLLKGKNKTVATFTIAPENGDSDMILEDFTLVVTGDNVLLSGDALRVKVDGTEEKDYTSTSTGVRYETSIELPSNGVVVEVVAKGEYNKVEAAVVNANSRSVYKDTAKAFEDVLVRIDSQETNNIETKWFFSVTKSDSDDSVSNVTLYTGTYADNDKVLEDTGIVLGDIEDGDDKSYLNLPKDSSDQYITAISYKVTSGEGGYCTSGTDQVNVAKENCTGTVVGTKTTLTGTVSGYHCPDGYMTGAGVDAIDENTVCYKKIGIVGGQAMYSDTDTGSSIQETFCEDSDYSVVNGKCRLVEEGVAEDVACTGFDSETGLGCTWERTRGNTAYSWNAEGRTVVIRKAEYDGFFKVGGSYATLFAKD